MYMHLYSDGKSHNAGMSHWQLKLKHLCMHSKSHSAYYNMLWKIAVNMQLTMHGSTTLVPHHLKRLLNHALH